jgi:hypothetical protein
MKKASDTSQTLTPDAGNNEKWESPLAPSSADLKKEIKYLPLFLVLTCVYFSEVFLRHAVLAIGDGFDEFYPLMITMSNQFKDFIFPFWNPYMYSGFPLFGSMQAGALYPFTIVLPLIFNPDLAFNLNLMLHYSLAGFFTFLIRDRSAWAYSIDCFWDRLLSYGLSAGAFGSPFYHYLKRLASSPAIFLSTAETKSEHKGCHICSVYHRLTVFCRASPDMFLHIPACDALCHISHVLS